MATVCISIDNDTVLTRFHRAMNRAGSMASDMILVKTLIDRGTVIKIVRTDCPWAIAVFRSLDSAEGPQ